MILSPRCEALGTPPGGRGYVTTGPICGPLLIPYPALKRWRPPRRQGLCYHRAHLWATSDCFPRSEALGTPQAAGVMLPLGPFGGPLLIPYPALKRWRPPILQGLCYHPAHLWASCDSVPISQALGTPHSPRVMFPLPICGPLLILSPALKRWRPPEAAKVMLPPGPFVGRL